MPGFKHIVQNTAATIDGGYQSDESTFLSDGGTSYHRGNLLGVGAFCRAYEMISADGQQKKAVLMPIRSGLIRMSLDPLSMDTGALDKLLKYKSAYILYNNSLYFREKGSAPVLLFYQNYQEIDRLFPKLDQLLWGSKKRLSALSTQLQFKAGQQTSLSPMDVKEVNAKFLFAKAMYPAEGVTLFFLNEDYRLYMPIIPGTIYQNLKISTELEQIALFISAVEALEKCHNVCSVIRLSRGISNKSPDELRDLLDNKPGYVYCSLSTHSEIYYVDRGLQVTPLTASDMGKLVEQFPSYSGIRRDATESNLYDIRRLTGHHHASGFVYYDLKSDNIFLDDDWNSNLADGGHSIPRGRWLPQRLILDSQKQVLEYRALCYHIAPELLTTVPVIAEYSADIFSLGRLMEEVLPQPIPLLSLLIDNCIKINPRERPTLSQLKELLLSLEVIYAFRRDISSLVVDFKQETTVRDVKRHQEFLQRNLDGLINDIELTNALDAWQLEELTSDIMALFKNKKEEVKQKATNAIIFGYNNHYALFQSESGQVQLAELKPLLTI